MLAEPEASPESERVREVSHADAVSALPVTSPVTSPVTLPVTLPVRAPVIVPALKLPELSRLTIADAVFAFVAASTRSV